MSDMEEPIEVNVEDLIEMIDAFIGLIITGEE